MIRQLLLPDLPKVLDLINENSTFQGRHLSEQIRGYFLHMAEKYITNNQKDRPYYGEFDELGNLLSFVRVDIWDPADEKACTIGLMCSTNKFPLPKAPGSRYSQTIVNLMKHVFEEMDKLGIPTAYTIRPAKNWDSLGTAFPYHDKLKFEIVKEVKPLTMSGDILLDKYVLLVPYLVDQVVVRMKKIT